MKLQITKSQKKAMLGGVAFEVTAKVVLTDEEQQLIKHYGIGDLALLSKKRVDILGRATEEVIIVTAKQVLSGESYKCKSLPEVVSYEQEIKEACVALHNYLAVATTFVGLTEYEIDAGEAIEIV